MSLAPSSRITASVPSGTDQSSRPSPPDAVSPDTPALIDARHWPLWRSAPWQARTERPPAPAGRTRPVSESPSATIFTGPRLHRHGGRSGQCRQTNNRDPRQFAPSDAILPYERNVQSATSFMNDKLHRQDRPSRSPASISRSGRGAARGPYSQGHRPHIGRGEAIGLVGPSGSGKIDPADGDGRAGTGRHRRDHGRRRGPRRARRGRAGALSRPQCRHRVPVVSSDPDHDGAGKRRRAAGAGRRARRLRRAREPSSPRSGSASGCIIIRRSFRAASSSASRWPARWRPIRRFWSPTSRPAISTRRPASRSSSCCSPVMSSAAPRWFW